MSKKNALSTAVEGKDVLMSEESTVYLVDVSGSMGYALGTYNGESLTKEDALKKALQAMFEARMTYAASDKVAVVTFGGQAYGDPLAKEVVSLGIVGKGHMSVLRYGSQGGTPMFQGFEKAAQILAECEGLVRIVLLSDGEPNSYTPPAGVSVKEAVISMVKDLSKDFGFVVDTVGIGGPNVVEYDEQFMKDLAKAGAGNFFPIDDVDKLISLLKESAIERRRYLGTGLKLLAQGLTVE